MFWGQEYGLQYMSGTTTNKIVWCSNGEVYIQNPVANYSTGTFAKGTYADGKITVELPQCIGSYYDTDGNMKDMYLNKLEEVEQDGEKYYMICYPEDNYLEYDVDDAGNVKLNLGNSADYDVTTGNNPKYLVGVTYSNEPHALQVWSGYGDTFETWNIIDNGEPVTPPADAVMQEWAFEVDSTGGRRRQRRIRRRIHIIHERLLVQGHHGRRQDNIPHQPIHGQERVGPVLLLHGSKDLR